MTSGVKVKPTVGGTHDGDFFLVGHALRHEPVDAVDRVIVHFVGPPTIAGSLDREQLPMRGLR
jgi:hypothetical protein